MAHRNIYYQIIYVITYYLTNRNILLNHLHKTYHLFLRCLRLYDLPIYTKYLNKILYLIENLVNLVVSFVDLYFYS